jgi:hypothetical protein
LEAKLYNEKHTKTILDSERLMINRKLNDLKNENSVMSREISRNKMFNKKDENRKTKKDTQDKLKLIMSENNKQLEDLDIDLDKKKRKLDDRNLLKKQ